METFDLEVKTESQEGTGQYINVNLYDAVSETPAQFFVFFNYGFFGGQIQYGIKQCLTDTWNSFEPALSKQDDPNRVWRFSVTRTEGDVRFVILDNEKEVLNILMGETCDKEGWGTVWDRKLSRVEFPLSFSAASEYRLRAKDSGD